MDGLGMGTLRASRIGESAERGRYEGVMEESFRATIYADDA